MICEQSFAILVYFFEKISAGSKRSRPLIHLPRFSPEQRNLETKKMGRQSRVLVSPTGVTLSSSASNGTSHLRSCSSCGKWSCLRIFSEIHAWVSWLGLGPADEVVTILVLKLLTFHSHWEWSSNFSMSTCRREESSTRVDAACGWSPLSQSHSAKSWHWWECWVTCRQFRL